MSKIDCPACGLKMDPGAFKNCPQCHTLIDDAPSDVGEMPEALLPDDEAAPNGETPETPPYAGEDAPPVHDGGKVPA